MWRCPQVDGTMEMAMINLGENTTVVSPKNHPLLERLQNQEQSDQPHRLGNTGSWAGVDVWTGKAVQMSGSFTLRPHASLLMQFTKQRS